MDYSRNFYQYNSFPSRSRPQGRNGSLAHDSARSSRHVGFDDGQILGNLRSHPMTAADFGTIALSLEGVEEYSHAGLPAFRVWRRRPRFSCRFLAAGERWDIRTFAWRRRARMY